MMETDKFEEIKAYFEKQNDWSTLTEFEYFQWLIQEVETLKNLLQYERVMHERSKNHFSELQEQIKILEEQFDNR